MIEEKILDKRNYKFLFDVQTNEYKGITREQPWCENTTHIAPHFQYGFKTVWDRNFYYWKLIPNHLWFEQMFTKDAIETVIEYKNEFVKSEIMRVCKDTGEIQTEVKYQTLVIHNLQQSILHVQKLIDDLKIANSNRDTIAHSRNQRLNDRIDLMISLLEKFYWSKRFHAYRIRVYESLYVRLSRLVSNLKRLF